MNSGGTVVSGAESYALAFNFAPVPEPSVCWLLVPGVVAMVLVAHRRKLRAGGRGVN